MSNINPLIYVLIRHYKSIDFLDKCLDSVLSQSYTKYKIIFIDDASGYNKTQKDFIKKKLKRHIVIFNSVRKYSLHNAYFALHKFGKVNDAIVFGLDGDDWLNGSDVFKYVADIYKKFNCLLTYGECFFWDGKNKSNASRFERSYTNYYYPKSIVNNRIYRKYPFLPLHPLTWRLSLFLKIKKADLLDSEGKFIRHAEDQAILYPMLEMANGNYKSITKPLYVYNIATINSDIKKNLMNLLHDEILIRKKKSYAPL